MARSYLDFEFENQPRWKDPGQPTTDQMVMEIVQYMKNCLNMPSMIAPIAFLVSCVLSLLAAHTLVM